VFAKTVPGFKDVPQESLQLFADTLGVALCSQMLIEHDIELLRRSGMRPQ